MDPAWCMGGLGLAPSKDYVLMLIATLETPFLNIWTLIFQILALPLCSAFTTSHSLTRISALRNFYLGHQKIIFSFLNAIKLNSGLRELPILSLPNFYRNLLSSETLRQLCSWANLPLVRLLILKMFLIKEAGEELRTVSIRPPPLLLPPPPPSQARDQFCSNLNTNELLTEHWASPAVTRLELITTGTQTHLKTSNKDH